MPQIAFFIPLNNCKRTIEGANLDIGNPGVGGTQYLFLLTVKVLNRLYGPDYSILLTNILLQNGDTGLTIDFAENEGEAIKYCESHNIGNLVFNANMADRVDPQVFSTHIDILLWAHNTMTAKRQIIAAKTNSIKWVVCVSESQYNNMADTPCYSKCTYINNVIPAFFYKHASLSDYSEEKAAYVGSLMPQKGAHNLIEIWKYVEKELPNAQLYIFGGANVWNTNVTVGSSGADIFYDRILQKRLNQLEHPENIHFMGAKGWTNIDSIISTFRLGIVNPSHYKRDETFCLSAIEMASHGLPIVSRQRNDGLATSVEHGNTGFLEKNDISIANRIVEILSNPEKSRQLGGEGRKKAEQFVEEVEIYKWRQLVESSRTETPHKRVNYAFFSKDAEMLRRDYFLKLCFLVESGKFIDLVKKKIGIGALK